jgi:hypothetical protein
MPYTGSKAQAGRGSSLLIGATPTEIGEVTDPDFQRGKWLFEDVTNLDSESDKEIIATIRDNGQVSFSGNRVAADAGQLLVEAAYQAGAPAAFTLQLPKTAAQTTAGDKYTFTAFVEDFNFTLGPTKKIEFKITLKTTGATALVAGS